MTKAELVEKIATESGLTKTDSEKALNAFISSVTNALKGGDSVTLVGFGTFSVSKRAAREGRNPQTGATLHIDEKNVPKFKPGANLKAAVEG